VKKLTAGGVRLATVDRGSGLPLLLVHGFPLDHTMWTAQIDALSQDYRVIAPDLRGFGESEVTGGKVTMEDFADDLAALLDALEIRRPVVFCGLSMGGYIAWQFHRRHTERTKALILCDTKAAADTPEKAQGRRETAQRVCRQGAEFLAEAMIPKLFSAHAIQNTPEVVDALRRVILSSARDGIAAAARGMAQRPDATGWLPRIACPTLVLVGSEDAISTVGEMRGMAEKIPLAQMVEIPQAGHMTTLEAPAAVNAALREFLAPLDDEPQP